MATLSGFVESVRKYPQSDVYEIVSNSLGGTEVLGLSDWRAEPLNATSVGNGTIGLVMVSASVNTRSGLVDWSAVVKGIGPPTWPTREAFNDPAREIAAYRSGFLDRVDSGLVAAPCYAVTDIDDEIAWLWLRDLTGEKTSGWDKSDFISAARHVGQFNGTWPELRAIEYEWIPADGSSDRRESAIIHRVPAFNELLENLEHPDVADVIGSIGARRYVRLLDDVQTLASSTNGFVRGIAHNDCHQENLFPARAADNSVITYAIDWASLTLSPIGIDGGTLAGGSIARDRDGMLLISNIEQEIFEAYMAGLEESGWSGPRDKVRLAYLSALAVYVLEVACAARGILSDPKHVKYSLGRMGGSERELPGQAAERLELFVPLIDEGLELAARI